MRQFTQEEARAIGERIGIEWGAGDVDLEQFRMGLNVELEHGSQEPGTDVTHDDEIISDKIALAHLREIPDYYTRLAAMERDANDSSCLLHLNREVTRVPATALNVTVGRDTSCDLRRSWPGRESPGGAPNF